MIGGTDIVIPTQASQAMALDLCVRFIRSFWREPVFENPDTGVRTDEYSELEFGRMSELFVYKSAPVADKWDQLGAVDDLANTMIHLLAGGQSLTVVVDNPRTDEMAPILQAIQDGLSMDILNVVADSGKEAA